MSLLIAVWMTTTMIMVMVGSQEAYEAGRVPRFMADVSRHFRRSKEPRETRGYVEHCRPTNVGKEQLGHVNVFAFLDPSWYYSYRQAVMLAMLKKRLESTGFKDILFFVVTPPSNLPEDDAENDVEIKAWREISESIMEPEYFLDAKETLFDNLLENKESVIFIRDTPELGIWENFHASKDEVVIVDRCGKLTYQVIVPWSILYFPYVKAAILSTYKDDPCGPCNEYSSTIRYANDYEELLLRNTDTIETEKDKNLDSFTEGTFSDMETTVTISSDESERSEDAKDSSSISPFDESTYKNTINDTITSDTSTIPIETTESIQVDNSTFATDTSIDVTSEVATERDQPQTSTIISVLEAEKTYENVENRVVLGKQINTDNENTFLANENLNANWDRKDYQGQPDVSLGSTKEDGVHKTSDEDIRQKDLQHQRVETLPLRIILYAPHLHKENGTLKKYTHLVLKAGSPDYHDHFHSKSTTYNEEPTELKKSDSSVVDDKKLTEYVHSKNESPGVYGEIADYWRTTNEEELKNKNGNTEFVDYDYATAEDAVSEVNDVSDSSILRPNDIDTIESDTNIKGNDEMDEITQQKLINHYNKLLTWIYYIL